MIDTLIAAAIAGLCGAGVYWLIVRLPWAVEQEPIEDEPCPSGQPICVARRAA